MGIRREVQGEATRQSQNAEALGSREPQGPLRSPPSTNNTVGGLQKKMGEEFRNHYFFFLSFFSEGVLFHHLGNAQTGTLFKNLKENTLVCIEKY